MPDHRVTELAGGLRVVSETMPSVHSVAVGFWVDTGSRAETDEQAGLSHLLEHLLFRGSSRFSSLEIDQIFDGMGAELNAGTGKEATSVHSRVPERHLRRAVEVMSDMVWRPAFEDADTERRVILQEIAMYEDEPQDKVFDVLGEAVFGSDPLGRAIIGRADVIRATPLEAIAAFHAQRYTPVNVVVSAAGAVDHDELVGLVAEGLPSAATQTGFTSPSGAPDLAARVRFEAKDTEQYHVCLGGPGLARDDERRFALRVLDNVWGGTASSRLFQEVRERRGLVYSIYSFTHGYAGAGQVGLYLGTGEPDLTEALKVVGGELRRMAEGPTTSDELERARENLKGRLALSLESTSARMHRLGSSLLHDIPLLGFAEIVERIDAVSADDLGTLTADLLDPARLSAAGVGPDEEVFRSALAPVWGEMVTT